STPLGPLDAAVIPKLPETLSRAESVPAQASSVTFAPEAKSGVMPALAWVGPLDIARPVENPRFHGFSFPEVWRAEPLHVDPTANAGIGHSIDVTAAVERAGTIEIPGAADLSDSGIAHANA